MKEQIEEMAKDLCQAEFWDVDEDCCDLELDRRKTAENLYNAGYRKQSEGVWTLALATYGKCMCSNCKSEAPIKRADDSTLEYIKSKYCPNCGASMKGGAE